MFNVISWPEAFAIYCKKERDAFATTFNMILEIKQHVSTPISAKTCTTAAKNFTQYVNAQKQQVTPDLRSPQDPLWTNNIEQDASESDNYFMNMIAEIDHPRKPTSALTVTRRTAKIIPMMQQWITQQFQIKTEEKLRSVQKKGRSHVAGKEQHCIFALDLQKNKGVRKQPPTTLQNLLDDYFSIQKVAGHLCKHCKVKHVVQKNTDITEAGPSLLINLKRFYWNRRKKHTTKLHTFFEGKCDCETLINTQYNNKQQTD